MGAELEGKLTQAADEREKNQSHIGIIGMAIEQLYQRALQSCRDDRRKQAMEDHTTSKFGHRDDLVLECIEERLNELIWIVEQCKKEVESRGKGPEKEAVNDSENILDKVRFINYDDNVVLSPKGDSAPLGGALSSQKLDKA